MLIKACPNMYHILSGAKRRSKYAPVKLYIGSLSPTVREHGRTFRKEYIYRGGVFYVCIYIKVTYAIKEEL